MRRFSNDYSVFGNVGAQKRSEHSLLVRVLGQVAIFLFVFNGGEFESQKRHRTGQPPLTVFHPPQERLLHLVGAFFQTAKGGCQPCFIIVIVGHWLSVAQIDARSTMS